MQRLLKAVLFDFDGTLTRPESLDLNAIREALGCPAALAILEYIQTLPAGRQRDQAQRILNRHELAAAHSAQPNQHAEELIAFLKKARLKLGILTRNSLAAVSLALRNFQQTRPADFQVIITRHDVSCPKPHPEGVLLAALAMGVAEEELLVVGDYRFDIEAGRSAGARTALLSNAAGACQLDPPADFSIKDLSELKPIISKLAAL